jgi:hypothetical protein
MKKDKSIKSYPVRRRSDDLESTSLTVESTSRSIYLLRHADRQEYKAELLGSLSGTNHQTQTAAAYRIYQVRQRAVSLVVGELCTD